MYNRLRNRKTRVIEEEKKIRINMVKKFCTLNNEKELTKIMKGIAPLLRNNKRSILLIGGKYEVNVETQKAIVTYMSINTKKGLEKASPMPKESEKSV